MRSNLSQAEESLFQEMCKVAPELRELRGEAERLLRDENDPDFWENYGEVKSKIAKLVGYRAPKSFPEYMHTPDSYDIVIKKVLGGLV